MSQQASITKLKEQIEAAKRSLSEMPLLATSDVVADGASTDSTDANLVSSSQGRVNTSYINAQSIDTLKSLNTTVVDLPEHALDETKKVLKISNIDTKIDKIRSNNLHSSSEESPFEGFHFFHRNKQLANTQVTELNSPPILDSNMDAGSDAANYLFKIFDCRLKAIEIDVAQNCLHIDELIKLSSRVVFSKTSVSAPKSMRRLLRRYVFWAVVGCLAIGWFALTPSGHIGLNYLLTLK